MKKILNKIIFRIRLLLASKQAVPSIEEKRDEIEHYRKVYSPEIFVETGTFLGDTVEYFKLKFDRVISIELSPALAEKAARRFADDKNVTIIQGDSSLVLPVLMTEMGSSVLFWLDGHYSSEFFVKDEFIQTAKGVTNTPIEKELDIILQSSMDVIILIDDARLFNGKDDYPSIKAIEAKVKSFKKDSEVFVEKDIIHILPNKK